MATKYLGGSFAPPLDDAKLDSYQSLAEAAGGPVGDSVKSLLSMVREFRKTPPSAESGVPHPVGRGVVTPLHPDEVKRIWDWVPWAHEIEGYKTLFETIPVEQKSLRDAAYHLLWFAVELEKDREPLTNDRL